MRLSRLLFSCMTIGIIGCSVQSINEEVNVEKRSIAEQVSLTEASINADVVLPASTNTKSATRMLYKRKVDDSAAYAQQEIRISGNNISLLRALTEPTSGINVLPKDNYVDLDLKLKLRIDKMPFDKYILYLQNVTGYEIKYVDGILEVRGQSGRIFNIAPLSLTSDGFDEIIKLVSDSIDNTRSGSFVGFTDNNSKLVIAGTPSEVLAVERIITKLLNDSMKQINLNLQVFSRTYGKSENLYQGQALIRNGVSGNLESGGLLWIPASMGSEGLNVKVGMGFELSPNITRGNEMIVRIKPIIKSISDKNGNEVVQSSEIRAIAENLKMVETEVVIRSGMVVDVAAGMSAMLERDVKIPVNYKGSKRMILFDNKNAATSLNEFKITLAAKLVEPI